MFNKPFSRTAAILLTACFAVSLNAAQHDKGATQYRLGTDAFRAGDLQQAARHFETAQRQGRESPALLYNLGVSHYKLRRYDASSRAFRELLNGYPEWTDLARYNLGLVAMRQGNTGEAERWFREVRRTSSNEKLMYLAGEGLRELGLPVVTAGREAGKKWFGLLSLAGGYDDNAIAFPDQLQTSQSQGADSFMELLAFGQGYLAGSAGDGLRLQGFAFLKQYNDLDVVDVSTFNGGLLRDRVYGVWGLEYGAGAGHTEVNGGTLTNQLQGKFQFTRYSGSNQYTAGYQPTYHDAGSLYGHLEGWQHRLDLRWRHRGENSRLTLRYRLELNDRIDLATDDTFLSYSPLRNGIMLESDWHLSPALTLTAGAGYENSRYGSENRLVDIDGELKVQERRSDALGFWVKGLHEFTPNWRVLAEYRYTDNDDNFILYQYKRNEAKVSMEFTF